MLENISVLIHSAIKFNLEKIIYFDPYKINKSYNDADIIFITHEHYDHFSIEDINKVIKEDTKIVMPVSMKEKIVELNVNNKDILWVEPSKQYSIQGIKFQTVPSYNVNKNFHPKENNWVGYILNYNNIYYYIPGDTDITEENLKIKCDVAFIPIGGTYTMNYMEAANLANEINPKVVVPIHYGCIVGEKDDALKFKELLDENIECHILIK